MSKIDQLFRARPIEFAAVRVADAIHAAGQAWNDLPDWLVAFYNQGLVIFMPNCIELTTSAGPVTVWPGDWVLCASGEISVSKGEDAFARYYEPAVDATDRTIAGHCPMGCGTTLFVGAGGHITCSHIPCPNPTAVDTILAEREYDLGAGRRPRCSVYTGGADTVKIIKEVRRPHGCTAELAQITEDLWAGSIVECSCGQQYIRRENQRDGMYWAPHTPQEATSGQG